MSPVLKKRPQSQLNLPIPEKKKHFVASRTNRPNQGENELLVALGTRITPEGYEYIGGYACHIYKHKMRTEVATLTHSAGLQNLTEITVLESIKELSRKLMTIYGHKAPRKRNEKSDVNVS